MAAEESRAAHFRRSLTSKSVAQSSSFFFFSSRFSESPPTPQPFAI
jgi:hypothetical protein